MPRKKRTPLWQPPTRPYIALSDDALRAEYLRVDASRDPDALSEAELDAIDSRLIALDDEHCMRGLDLPRATPENAQ